MKLAANPYVLHAGVVLFCAGCAFLMGMIFIRLLRKTIEDEAKIESDTKPSFETLPMHLYNTVIKDLKQQKHELITQSQADQNRARASEILSQAVLSNLSCGVLVFGTNGLVKSSNPAAREIMGFASPAGMGAEDIFRGAVVRKENTEPQDAMDGDSSEHDEPTDQSFAGSIDLADEVEAALREASDRREAQAEYETPAGETRFLAVTVFPVKDVDGSLLGVACLINDHSELERIRQKLASKVAYEVTNIEGSLNRSTGSPLEAKSATQGATAGN